MVGVWFKIALGLSLGTSACNIFGPDDRVELTLSSPFGTSVGIVYGESSCSGSLVGYRFVVTAAHCLSWDGKQLDMTRQPYFSLNQRNGMSSAIKDVRAIDGIGGSWREEGDPRSEDWAVLVLEDTPKLRSGTLTWLNVRAPKLMEGDVVSTAGYSHDFQSGSTPSVHSDCQIKAAFSDGLFFHDCDGYSGISGGPVVQSFKDASGKLTPEIVGITNSHFSDGTPGLHLPAYVDDSPNVGISSEAFLPSLEFLKQRYPSVTP